jgi:uncharacterized protein DUF1186/SEC-C motif-containing protein
MIFRLRLLEGNTTMKQNLVDQLRYKENVFPQEILEDIVNNREQYTPELLNIIEYSTNHMQELQGDPDNMAHIYAIYLLAQFREKKAYQLIVDFFSVPGEISVDITGDLVTEDLGQILASVSCGDTSRMVELGEDIEINEYVRSASLQGLLTLVVCGEKSRDEVMAYYKSLFHKTLTNDESEFLLDDLSLFSTELYPEEVLHEIEQAHKKEMLDLYFLSIEDVKNTLSKGKESVLRDLQKNPRYQLVQDVIGEMGKWACFNQKEHKSSMLEQEDFYNINPIGRKSDKIGRNEPCPCGSGKKYKKCCGSN